MNNIRTIAAKEIRDGTRNRWILMITFIMAGLALLLALLGSAPTGTTSVSPLSVTIVSLSSLSIFFIPLIALLLAYDAIVGEAERGTLLLLLAHPVARWQVVIGKFCGHLVLLATAILVGYGLAGLVISLSGEADITASVRDSFVRLLISSVMLGAIFLALGYLISAAVGERGTAAAIAIGVWLVLVLLYDMGMLAMLAADGGQTIDQRVVTWMLLANPTDAYRMFNLTGDAQTALLSGMSGLSARLQVPVAALVGLMTGWILIPLLVACLIFRRRQL
ncbi:MAG: ABC transporter permease [Fimbriimonadaceae bacterium]|nr:ABC transporter permease [Alphaproteobacteria bacterium]